LHIIETAVSIPTKFCTYHQILFVGGPNAHTRNPRWRTVAILKIVNLWPYLGNGSTDLHEI